MSTGRVGGSADVEGSKKVKISHSSAIVQGIVAGTIRWEEDPDFGYHVAASVPEFDDEELLRPRQLYDRQGRSAEYKEIVQELTDSRRAYLSGFSGLASSIVSAI
jgi:phosphoenolpyruvate carboxykinase (ATP)